MRIPEPKFQHSSEVYQAIIAEHVHSAVRMAERLQACGWTMADAAWTAVNWDLRTLAAAIANERTKWNLSVTTASTPPLASEPGETRQP